MRRMVGKASPGIGAIDDFNRDGLSYPVVGFSVVRADPEIEAVKSGNERRQLDHHIHVVGSGLATDERLASRFGLHDRGGTLIDNVNRDEYRSSSWFGNYRRMAMKAKLGLPAFKSSLDRYKANCRCWKARGARPRGAQCSLVLRGVLVQRRHHVAFRR